MVSSSTERPPEPSSSAPGSPPEAFESDLGAGYALEEPAIVLGSPIRDGSVLASVRVQVALSMLNRHGLVAGATGTGKTKTLQLMAGQLSDAGVPVFVADVKGDLTGLAVPGDASDPKVQERAESLAWPFQPKGHPVEFLSLSGRLGAQVRATVHSFGPLLLGKVLDLNKTQTAVLTLAFKYCDDQALPLLDLADLRTTLRFLGSAEGKAVIEEYGGMSAASLGVIQRSILTLEQEGAGVFFGEPEFDVADLLRTTPDGAGVISVLELSDVMAHPRLFSTFMLWLLARLYETLPEAGDLPRPKLCFFFDEAHLLFEDASEALLDEVEQTARLIRSKGVGVYFVTHSPTDVPSSVLSQLSNRVQHAIRAFTPEDADNLRKAARTLPMTDFYDVEETMTSLGIGEALVTVLSPAGVPTPLAATRLVPPDSRMGTLDPADFQARVAAGPLAAKYGQTIDRDSAHEMLGRRLEAARSGVAAAPAVSPTTAGGLNQMTPSQQEAEIKRQRNEAVRQERAQRAAREDAERQERTRRREEERAARQRERIAGQVIRGVFGVLRRL
jgi:DNA double-strand break repair helicase HerA and related ATPase